MRDWDISEPIPAELAGFYLGWLRAEISFVLSAMDDAAEIRSAKRLRERTKEIALRLRTAEVRGLERARIHSEKEGGR